MKKAEGERTVIVNNVNTKEENNVAAKEEIDRSTMMKYEERRYD
jgi:hypothetical protein